VALVSNPVMENPETSRGGGRLDFYPELGPEDED